MTTYPEGASDITDPDAARAAVTTLEGANPLAVDIEYDAMHAFRARVCFIQVGTDKDVFLFDTLAPGVDPAVVKALLEDANRLKYFHAAGGDLQYLAEANVRVRGLFDTHRAATLLGWQKVGLADLARDLLGVELKKDHQQSDFSLRPTPPGMREYIADDVRYLCELGRRVMEACRTADILEEVELDCLRLTEEAAERPPIEEFNPKLPRGSLSTKQLLAATAIAQELHRLRLIWAEAANVPMGRMLSNAAVTAVATKPPTSLKELARAQGVRGQVVREHGEEVLSLCRKLQEQAEKGELHRDEGDRGSKDPNRRKREDALKAFRAEKAGARKVTPSVVLSNGLVSDLCAARPRSLEELAQIKYLGEKRLGLYGPALLEVLGRH
ncbi:MAG: ribonuclease D [Myxococcaceae bacterium]